MIELIEGLPDAVVGFEAVGEVESADYETIARPAVKQALERHPKIRLIHVLDDRFTGYTAGGAWQDALLGLAHPRSFDRIAVVSDLESIRRLVTLAGWSIPGGRALAPDGMAPPGGGQGSHPLHKRPRRRSRWLRRRGRLVWATT